MPVSPASDQATRTPHVACQIGARKQVRGTRWQVTAQRTSAVWVLGVALVAATAAGCTVQTSNLVTAAASGAGGASAGNGGMANSGGAAGAATMLSPAVIAAIDERPIGGASLTTGTQGGGTYESAAAAGAIVVVSSLDGLLQAVSGDTPAVVLVTEGTYEGSSDSRTFEVCSQACDPTTPLATQTIVSSYCTNGETLSSVDVNYDTLRIGSHKTIIGLGAGAVLRNVGLTLAGSTDVILRNLAIEDLSPDIASSVDGFDLWPSDHVWIDHMTFRNISRAYLNIVSSWDQENDQALTIETGFITITHCDFDGFVAGACGQRSGFVLGTSRDPALTIAHNWFHDSSNRNTYLFGPGTWAHVFNNYWSNIDHTGLGVACGAVGLVQGNVFEATQGALYNNDDGTTVWTFCATGYYGTLYAPTTTGDDEANSLDANSTTSLHSQPTDGGTAVLPRRISGHEFEVTVPVALGTSTETYRVTLAADPSTVPAEVQANAGIGHMF